MNFNKGIAFENRILYPQTVGKNVFFDAADAAFPAFSCARGHKMEFQRQRQQK